MAASSKRGPSWQTIFTVLAVIVALVLGAAVGSVAEHKRLQNKTKAQATLPAASTTTTPISTIDWFGNNATAACPGLLKWYGAVGAIASAMKRKVPWAATRAKFRQEVGISQAAFRSLIPLVNPAGKVELAFLATSLDRTNALLNGSASQTAFLAAQKAATSAQVIHDTGVVLLAAKSCRS
jgi:hypothetical protein